MADYTEAALRDYPKQCNLRTMQRFTILLIVAVLITACGNGAEDGDVVRGRQLFSEHCVACHSLSPEVVIVGPSLAGVATRAATDNDSVSPREILRRSIVSPQAEIVEGFSNLMPPDFKQKLIDSDLEALISFLLTLE